jgi:hypothetical protein
MELIEELIVKIREIINSFFADSISEETKDILVKLVIER